MKKPKKCPKCGALSDEINNALDMCEVMGIAKDETVKKWMCTKCYYFFDDDEAELEAWYDGKDFSKMTLSQISDVIFSDWRDINPKAFQCADAMRDLDSIDDMRGSVPADNIVTHFLVNAGGWKTETAKRVKEVLRKMWGMLKAEDIKIDRLSITAIFFDGKFAKVNAYIKQTDSDESVPMCFDMKRKSDVWDLLLFCPDWEKILALNDIEFQQTQNHTRAYQHRIQQAINNDISDVITLAFSPIVIEDVYLDWETRMKEDGTIEVLLTNFNKL